METATAGPTERAASLEQELSAVLDQQAATREVLRIISRSAHDVQPVFEAIAESTARLCRAEFAAVYRFDGTLIHFVAHHALSARAVEAMSQVYPVKPGRATTVARSILNGSVEQIPDVLADTDYAAGPITSAATARSIAAVPMLKDGRPIGSIAVARPEPGYFPERDIRLLETFADQAVIAIENVRLFEETQQRNRELAATSEVLRVISRSPTDVQPVFEVVAESAARLCEAYDSIIFVKKGEDLAVGAHHGPIPLDWTSRKISRHWFTGRAVLDRVPMHIHDLLAEGDEFPESRADAMRQGHRTILAVPLLSEGEAIGALVIRRLEVRPFSPKQIDLLHTFADQAVIAIKNVRLFKELEVRTEELSESLRQQTATAEVLKTISRSTFDLPAVLNALVASAAKLCNATYGGIFLRDGDVLRGRASYGAISEDDEDLKANPIGIDRRSVSGRVMLSGKIEYVPDHLADPEYDHRLLRLANCRAIIGVPLLREGKADGVFFLAHPEPGAFSARQQELVQTFADQAVIAIENVRLFEQVQTRTTELTEALEQQTATSNVLKVISRSAFDLNAVFQTLLDSAARLCAADRGVISLRDGDVLRIAAGHHQVPENFAYEQAHPHPIGRGTFHGRAALEGATIHVPDVLLDPEYERREAAVTGKFRAVLAVPIRREGDVIGVFGLGREAPGPFSSRQIELVETFADQAAIAIENVRLFDQVQARTRELQEALDHQTATSEVLNVISRSPAELQPVLDVIIETAVRLCEADFGTIARQQDGHFIRSGQYGSFSDDFKELMGRAPVEMTRGTITGRTLVEGKVVHVLDAKNDPEYSWTEALEFEQIRTGLGVPLLRYGVPIGAIALVRRAVMPFSNKQIELVTTFADQAVIAIENARLFEEVQARTRELTEALEYQTAISDVLSVISRSPSQAQPVLDTIVATSAHLCESDYAFAFMRKDDGRYHWQAGNLVDPSHLSFLQANPISPDRGTATGRAALERRTIHIPDASADPDYAWGEWIKLSGTRTFLGVPLLRDGDPIGVISAARKRTEPFTTRQIELITTFADQAVIAIENARLFNEVQTRNRELTEALEQQTATGAILRAIAGSPTDIQPVLNAVAESAAKLCEAYDAAILLKEGESLAWKAHHGPIPIDFAQWPIGRDWVTGRAFVDRKPIHVHDLREAADEYPAGQAMAVRLGHRTMLAVPLLREDEAIGALVIRRLEVRPFAQKQIELLTTFADQAVIAIENVRLFEEVQARTAELSESLQQQTATADVLKVISRSSFDLKSVLQTLVESAARLCDADRGTITRQIDGVFFDAEAYGLSAELIEYIRTIPIKPDRGSAAGRVLLEGKVIHIADVKADPEYTYPQEAQRLGGYRTLLGVPMLREGVPIGVLTLGRPDVRQFTDKQIELVSTFADQAAIAIENARLFDEVQARTRELEARGQELSEALRQQTATADVLKVISRSTFDLKSVLQTLVESAARLCEADKANITRLIDGVFFRTEFYGATTEFMEYMRTVPVVPDRGSAQGRALLEGRVVHIADVEADPEYTFEEAKKLGGFRTVLGVPMMREGVPIGSMALTRSEVRPFTEKQIELVSTFADQAAIAIENVRLFESVEARTRELGRSLEELRSAQDRLIQTEKLASLGQLTAGIAHEIKNPLNFVNNFAAVSRELIDEIVEGFRSANLDDKVRSDIGELMSMLSGNLAKISDHGRRADSIVKNMLLHSRQGSSEHRLADLNAVLEESLNLAYHGARAERQDFNITLEKSLDPAAGEVDLYPQEITRVFLNLISNGFYATIKRKTQANGESYEPTLSVATRNLGNEVEIRIRDNGTGIPPEVRDKIFNPFFTTKPAGEGTGLGLSLSYDIIVKQHAGKIDLDTRPGEFTEFRIVLPRNAASEGRSGAPT